MIEIGKINTLTILRETSVGLYLGDNENNEVLLPVSFIKDVFNIGDKLNIFIYKDSEDRLIATTTLPYVKINEFAYLRVVSVSEVGAFLDWGLEKDLFVPFREQARPMQAGKLCFCLMHYWFGAEAIHFAAFDKI